MDFFFSRDWLNRPGPSYAFKLDHILFIVISMVVGVLLAILLRKCKRKTIGIVILSLWAFGLTVDVIHHVFVYVLCAIHYKDYVFNISTMLPFHSCSMFFYVFPFAFFSKNEKVRIGASNFVVIVNMIMGFITLFVGCPPSGYSALSFDGIHTLTYHVIIVIVPLIMVVTGYYDIKIKDIKYGYMVFTLLSIFMWTFDRITGSDYFYFYDGHTFPVFKFISENVHHLVWTLLIVFVYMFTGAIVHFLIIWIKHLTNKKR